MLISDDSNRFLSKGDLQSLSKMRSEHGLIFSLYLDLRASRGLRERFQDLLKQSAAQMMLDKAPAGYREVWKQEAERIGQWLIEEQPEGGQGLAILSSLPEDLWEVYMLPAPVMDRLETKDQPFIRPLEILLGEFQCTLVALINAGAARLVKINAGQAEEIAQVEAVPVTGGEIDATNPHVRAVIEMVQDAWAGSGCGQLIIGGDDTLLDELRDALPIPLQERLTGEISLSPLANLEAILNEAVEIQQAHERRLEAQRVDELISSASGANAVLGLEQTLRAVAGDRKVRMLIVEEDFREEGGECPNCGYLSDDEQGACLRCGFSMRREPDVIEPALKRVLDEGGEIEILRGEPARSALKDHGRIGALLHDAADTPLRERETANQQTISVNGEIHREPLHDETLQESFPASDPPGGW